MRHAVVDGAVVVNIVMAEPAVAAARGWIAADAAVSIGWLWDGEAFAPPPPEPAPVPETVSRFQARAALLQAGLLSAVEDAVAAADPMVQLAWAEAVEWRRQSPTILALGAAIGLAEAQLDDLFRAAAEIEL